MMVTAIRIAHYHAPRGTWDRKRIVAAMLVWRAETGTPPRSYDWAPDTGRAMGMLGPERTKWELEHPRWPSTACVVQHHGSWSAAVRAAGLHARIPERDMNRRQRVEAAQRLSAVRRACGFVECGGSLLGACGASTWTW